MTGNNNNSFLTITNGFSPVAIQRVHADQVSAHMIRSAREINKLLEQIILTSSPRAPMTLKSRISFNPELIGPMLNSHFFIKSLGFTTLNNRTTVPHWLTQIPQRDPSRLRAKQRQNQQQNQRPSPQQAERALFGSMNLEMRTPSAPPAHAVMPTPSAPPAPLPDRANWDSPQCGSQAAQTPDWNSFSVAPSAPPLSQMKISPPPYQERWDDVNMAREAYDEAPPPSYQKQWAQDPFETPVKVDLMPPPAYISSD